MVCLQVSAQQRSESGIPRSPGAQAGAREAASSAAREESMDGAESAEMPPKSPLTSNSPGACLVITESTWCTPLSHPCLGIKHVMVVIPRLHKHLLPIAAGLVLYAAYLSIMVLGAGYRRLDGKQAAPKAPPHSFLPNLQPGRASPAARRGEVLAGPLTRASTPQSRSQVRCTPKPHHVRQTLLQHGEMHTQKAPCRTALSHNLQDHRQLHPGLLP